MPKPVIHLCYTPVLYTCVIHLCYTPVLYTCVIHLCYTPVLYTCVCPSNNPNIKVYRLMRILTVDVY